MAHAVTLEEIVEVLKELNYDVTKNDGQYLEAYSKHVWSHELNCAISTKEKRKLQLNYDKDYIFFGIREDYDTRCVINGYIETADDLRRMDKLTRILPKERVDF